MGKNDEDRLADDIQVFKLVKLSSQKNIDNVEKEYGKINRIYMNDDKDSDEIYKISENDKYRLTDDIEVLKLGRMSLQKNMDNVEK